MPTLVVVDTTVAGPWLCEAAPPWAGASLRRLVDLARNFVRSAVETPEQRELRNLVQRVAERIGAPILNASTVEDVRRAIGRALSDPEPYRLNARVNASVTLHDLAEADDVELSPEFVRVLGETSARKIANASLLGQAAFREWVRLILGLNDAQRAEAARGIEIVRDDPAAFVYDPQIPLPVREALLDGLRGLPAILAIAYAIAIRKPLPGWLAFELAGVVERSQKGLLRVLASAPGSSVPEAILPRAERFDDAALRREREEAHGRAEEWARLAATSGQDVYFVDPQ